MRNDIKDFDYKKSIVLNKNDALSAYFRSKPAINAMSANTAIIDSITSARFLKISIKHSSKL